MTAYRWVLACAPTPLRSPLLLRLALRPTWTSAFWPTFQHRLTWLGASLHAQQREIASTGRPAARYAKAPVLAAILNMWTKFHVLPMPWHIALRWTQPLYLARLIVWLQALRQGFLAHLLIFTCSSKPALVLQPKSPTPALAVQATMA